jgi:hypothetical protein
MTSFKFGLPESRRRPHEAEGQGPVETPRLIASYTHLLPLTVSVHCALLVLIENKGFDAENDWPGKLFQYRSGKNLGILCVTLYCSRTVICANIKDRLMVNCQWSQKLTSTCKGHTHTHTAIFHPISSVFIKSGFKLNGGQSRIIASITQLYIARLLFIKDWHYISCIVCTKSKKWTHNMKAISMRKR